MAITKGERYRCQDQHCGAEVAVIVSSGEAGGDLPLRCCCGQEMYLVQEAPEDARTANA